MFSSVEVNCIFRMLSSQIGVVCMLSEYMNLYQRPKSSWGISGLKVNSLDVRIRSFSVSYLCDTKFCR
jgi:hypothetical protein